MTRVSVAVMAHPRRADLVEGLVGRLDRLATVVWDQGNDEWGTGSRAWEAHDPTCTHHLVLQDDAVICRDLVAGVEAALGHIPPGSPLCLYFGARVPYQFHTARLASQTSPDTSWLAIDGMHWGVAVVLPAPLIGPMLAAPDKHPYDQRISRWLKVQGVTTWYPWPSLVDHQDGPSLIPGHGRTPGRRAHRFLGQDRSALDVDWSGSVVHAGELGKRNRPRPTPRPARPARNEVPNMSIHSEGLVIAVNNATMRGEGRDARIFRNKTVAHTGSWVVQQRPDLWRPLRIDFPAENPAGTEPAAEPSEPAAAASSDGQPSAKDVRAWAKETGVAVPSRGPIPDEVVAQYQADRPPSAEAQSREW